MSPLLWNPVVDRLSTITNDLGFSTFGYADYFIIIVQVTFALAVREILQEAMNVEVKWAVKEGVTISTSQNSHSPIYQQKEHTGLRISHTSW